MGGLSSYASLVDEEPSPFKGFAKLNSNENPFGPSPKAVKAYLASGEALHRYPSTSHDHLRKAISKVLDLPGENIICGVGSDEIISLLCQTFSGRDDEVIYTEHGFAMYKISALAAGANPVVVKEEKIFFDVCVDINTDRTFNVAVSERQEND